MRDPPSNRVWLRQDQDDAWEVVEEEESHVSPHLVPVLQELGIPHGPDIVKSVSTFQIKRFTTPDGQVHVSLNRSKYHLIAERALLAIALGSQVSLRH